MKRIFVSAFASLGVAAAFSQEKAEKSESKPFEDRKNELKIGTVKLVAGPIFEGTYEYIANETMSYGVSVLGNFQSKSDENRWIETFSVAPFTRVYINNDEENGLGVFFEGSFKYISGMNEIYEDISGYDPNTDNYYYYTNYKQEKFKTGSFGLAAGYKWGSKKGVIVEFLAGANRLWGGKSIQDVVFRGDVSIGYRF